MLLLAEHFFAGKDDASESKHNCVELYPLDLAEVVHLAVVFSVVIAKNDTLPAGVP